MMSQCDIALTAFLVRTFKSYFLHLFSVHFVTDTSSVGQQRLGRVLQVPEL